MYKDSLLLVAMVPSAVMKAAPFAPEIDAIGVPEFTFRIANLAEAVIDRRSRNLQSCCVE